jgi:hypothetical protein
LLWEIDGKAFLSFQDSICIGQDCQPCPTLGQTNSPGKGEAADRVWRKGFYQRDKLNSINPLAPL